MGGWPSRTVVPVSTDDDTAPVKWKVKPSATLARSQFSEEGTLSVNDKNSGHLELRLMLDDPVSQNALGKFAGGGNEVYFMCWIDIQEFKTIPTDNYRRSKALHIYNKYLNTESNLCLGHLPTEEVTVLHIALDMCKHNAALLTAEFFDSIQSLCFESIYDLIYLPFKRTKLYDQLSEQLNNNYNRVKMSDFEFYGKLGEGGFGVVVHCKKKSTGKTE